MFKAFLKVNNIMGGVNSMNGKSTEEIMLTRFRNGEDRRRDNEVLGIL